MAINTLFQNIANAIRVKGGGVNALTPAEMPQAILDIPSGGEVVWQPSPLTSNETNAVDVSLNYKGGTYRASASNNYNTSELAYKVFRQTYATQGTDCWHGVNNVSPQWLQIEFPVTARLRAFTMANRSTNIESPRTFYLQGSNDGETFVNITEELVFTQSGRAGVVMSYEFENNTYYKYYRWLITSFNNYCVISYIKFDDIDLED